MKPAHKGMRISQKEFDIVAGHLKATLNKFKVPKQEQKDIVFQLLDEHIRSFGIEVEGINMISAISSCYKREFKNRID